MTIIPQKYPFNEDHWSQSSDPVQLFIRTIWDEHLSVPFEEDYTPTASIANVPYSNRKWTAREVAKAVAKEARINGISMHEDTLHIPASSIRFIRVEELIT